ncbi:MAG: ribosome maturation factor RimP [Alphaproteobacteria bacterium]|nr:ribosome maturation factor RimP [Alphaproteobacteria bacterium]MCK5518517.1 ribosome maturation factor RimP [Alphaproteobacteria bacterium]
MNKTPLIKKIEHILTPVVESMGFEIVRILMTGSGRPTLQIMAERADGTITVDECGKLSQAISTVLDVENVLENSSYYLEVGSPGLDRPLTRLKDFERYAGMEARIEISPAIGDCKRFNGLLKGVMDDCIMISTEEGDKEIPFSFIEKAKLVLTEDLLKQTQKKVN